MVTARHEAMHRIFQEDPGVFARAFNALEIPIPAPTGAAVLSPDTTEFRPLERRVDSVIRFETADHGPFLLALEAQCRKDAAKPGAWAYYAAYLHEKHGLPVVVLVVCQDKTTAGRAELPSVTGLPIWPTLTLRPLVLGPHNVPVVTDTETAANDIPLATLSAITHGRNRNKINPILKALGAALHSVDEETAQVFAELTELGLGRAQAARTWSNMMAVDLSFYRSRTSQRLRAEGLAEGIFAVLAERKVFVPDDVRARIEACEDHGLLKAWLSRAREAADAEDIFGDLPDD
jgi:hypothetical protein